MGELDREIAAGLLGLAAADGLALPADAEILILADDAAAAEQAEEGVEAVIPVVIARNCVKMRPVCLVVRPARRSVAVVGVVERADEPVAILLARRGRIDLVAAENEQAPARQRTPGGSPCSCGSAPPRS